MMVLQLSFTMFGDAVFIPILGTNGTAYTDFSVNCILIGFCLIILLGERLLTIHSLHRSDLSLLKEWSKSGLFAGGQILLDNIIYALMICKMVNVLSEQGNYWVANNYIWGFLLPPVLALAEIVKRDCSQQQTLRLQSYFPVSLLILLFWGCNIFGWPFMLNKVLGISDPTPILAILETVGPFYTAYLICSILDGYFYGTGYTKPLFIISFAVNIIYYGVYFVLFKTGQWIPSMDSICVMFGGGMVFHAVLSLFFCIKEKAFFDAEVREFRPTHLHQRVKKKQLMETSDCESKRAM